MKQVWNQPWSLKCPREHGFFNLFFFFFSFLNSTTSSLFFLTSARPNFVSCSPYFSLLLPSSKLATPTPFLRNRCPHWGTWLPSCSYPICQRVTCLALLSKSAFRHCPYLLSSLLFWVPLPSQFLLLQSWFPLALNTSVLVPHLHFSWRNQQWRSPVKESTRILSQAALKTTPTKPK